MVALRSICRFLSIVETRSLDHGWHFTVPHFDFNKCDGRTVCILQRTNLYVFLSHIRDISPYFLVRRTWCTAMVKLLVHYGEYLIHLLHLNGCQVVDADHFLQLGALGEGDLQRSLCSPHVSPIKLVVHFLGAIEKDSLFGKVYYTVKPSCV